MIALLRSCTGPPPGVRAHTDLPGAFTLIIISRFLLQIQHSLGGSTSKHVNSPCTGGVYKTEQRPPSCLIQVKCARSLKCHKVGHILSSTGCRVKQNVPAGRLRGAPDVLKIPSVGYFRGARQENPIGQDGIGVTLSVSIPESGNVFGNDGFLYLMRTKGLRFGREEAQHFYPSVFCP